MKLPFKRFIVFGLGRTGKSCVHFFQHVYPGLTGHQDFELITVDGAGSAVEGVEAYLDSDKDLMESLGENDLVVWSPGIPWTNPFLMACGKSKTPVWSEIELASRFFKKPIYALTGTNGKTTTVSLIHHIFQNSGKKSFLGGNIGIPFIEAISKPEQDFDLAVLELSSFQLEAIEQFKPKVAGILNLYQNHEERYEQFSDYVAAKTNIVKNMEALDSFFCRKQDLSLMKPEALVGKKVVLLPKDFQKNDSSFWGAIDLNQFTLEGEHNLENLAMAVLFTLEGGLSDQQITQSLSSFEAVEFRLQKLTGYAKQGLNIFNDSKSTNYNATLTAVKAMGSKPLLIMGGKLRTEEEGDDSQLLGEIAKASLEIVTFGEAADTLRKQFNSLKMKVESFKDLEGVIEHLKNHGIETLKKGTPLVFSPGYPSFDQYKNYLERGKHFTQLISDWLEK